MDYGKVERSKRESGFLVRLRLAFWKLAASRARASKPLDPQALPDHLLRDMGVRRPNPAWDNSVAFWRDR
jgi:hypothetical protein